MDNLLTLSEVFKKHSLDEIQNILHNHHFDNVPLSVQLDFLVACFASSSSNSSSSLKMIPDSIDQDKKIDLTCDEDVKYDDDTYKRISKRQKIIAIYTQNDGACISDLKFSSQVIETRYPLGYPLVLGKEYDHYSSTELLKRKHQQCTKFYMLAYPLLKESMFESYSTHFNVIYTLIDKHNTIHSIPMRCFPFSKYCEKDLNYLKTTGAHFEKAVRQGQHHGVQSSQSSMPSIDSTDFFGIQNNTNQSKGELLPYYRNGYPNYIGPFTALFSFCFINQDYLKLDKVNYLSDDPLMSGQIGDILSKSQLESLFCIQHLQFLHFVQTYDESLSNPTPFPAYLIKLLFNRESDHFCYTSNRCYECESFFLPETTKPPTAVFCNMLPFQGTIHHVKEYHDNNMKPTRHVVLKLQVYVHSKCDLSDEDKNSNAVNIYSLDYHLMKEAYHKKFLHPLFPGPKDIFSQPECILFESLSDKVDEQKSSIPTSSLSCWKFEAKEGNNNNNNNDNLSVILPHFTPKHPITSQQDVLLKPTSTEALLKYGQENPFYQYLCYVPWTNKSQREITIECGLGISDVTFQLTKYQIKCLQWLLYQEEQNSCYDQAFGLENMNVYYPFAQLLHPDQCFIKNQSIYTKYLNYKNNLRFESYFVRELVHTSHQNNTGGVIGCEPRLGKTILSLSLISYQKKKNTKEKATLIIAPSNTILQSWIPSLNNYAPHLKFINLGLAKDRKYVVDLSNKKNSIIGPITKKKYKTKNTSSSLSLSSSSSSTLSSINSVIDHFFANDTVEPKSKKQKTAKSVSSSTMITTNPDIILCPLTLLSQTDLDGSLHFYEYDRVILDEAHSVSKEHWTKQMCAIRQLHTKKFWLLTGTPFGGGTIKSGILGNILNSVFELNINVSVFDLLGTRGCDQYPVNSSHAKNYLKGGQAEELARILRFIQTSVIVTKSSEDLVQEETAPRVHKCFIHWIDDHDFLSFRLQYKLLLNTAIKLKILKGPYATPQDANFTMKLRSFCSSFLDILRILEFEYTKRYVTFQKFNPEQLLEGYEEHNNLLSLPEAVGVYAASSSASLDTSNKKKKTFKSASNKSNVGSLQAQFASVLQGEMDKKDTTDMIITEEHISKLLPSKECILHGDGKTIGEYISKEDTCGVCLGDMSFNIYALICLHCFCAECTLLLFSDTIKKQKANLTCPMCNKLSELKDVQKVIWKSDYDLKLKLFKEEEEEKKKDNAMNDIDMDHKIDILLLPEGKEEKKEEILPTLIADNSSLSHLSMKSADQHPKMIYLLKMLKKIRHQHYHVKNAKTIPKILIFSEFVSTCRAVYHYLKSEPELSKLVLHINQTDSMKVRQKNFDAFTNENDPSQILICSLKQSSVGIDLSVADHLIFMEPCTAKDMELQAINRIFHIKKNHEMNIHYLVIKNTIEESIIQHFPSELQKQEIFQQVFEVFEKQIKIKRLEEESKEEKHQQDEDDFSPVSERQIMKLDGEVEVPSNIVWDYQKKCVDKSFLKHSIYSGKELEIPQDYTLLDFEKLQRLFHNFLYSNYSDQITSSSSSTKGTKEKEATKNSIWLLKEELHSRLPLYY